MGALRSALMALLIHSVLAAWARLAKQRRNALTVLAARGHEAAEVVTVLCRILAVWQRRVLRAAMKESYACHREALRRAVSTACRVQWAQLGPGRLRAILALWRLRARTTGLTAWRWSCYKHALLRAAVDAWHLAILNQRGWH